MNKIQHFTVKNVNYILDKTGFTLNENVVGHDGDKWDFGLSCSTYTKYKYIGLYNGKISELVPDIIGQAVSFNFCLGQNEKGNIDDLHAVIKHINDKDDPIDPLDTLDAHMIGHVKFDAKKYMPKEPYEFQHTSHTPEEMARLMEMRIPQKDNDGD